MENSGEPLYIYLDTNIFDRIEKKEKLSVEDCALYSKWEKLILDNTITVPYSNAHLNDLFRGFQKDPNYISGHLYNIERLTKNLCICQYWGNKHAVWHYRPIHDFFDEKCKEWEFEPSSIEELFDSDMDMPNPLQLLRMIPLPNEWKLAYKHDPMFDIMYPKSKMENTLGALVEDILNFQSRLRSDYSLYRSLRANIIKGMNKLKKNREVLKVIKENFQDLPKHLDIFELSEIYGPKSKTSENEDYSKVVETFYKYDLKGYKSDSNFSSMFDDSLHTFYGAHCDYFVTNDDRCKYKAEQTYKRLKKTTVVITAKEIERIHPL
ncbi:hypothetical protein PY092_12445 [Muricauda sp. 334s03]|uniref:DUF4935 domain-containing protein n=1 Tax=Flagellimonas yonaguniensis TaxID=3031325 RepID=A0ABT5Y0J2_9FLAO|nr:hypothetical protein [[Muricauda] yonaguniensis]MDF0716963.1 hypothetical protein [[Muricauda] yonaguniensis]